MYRPIYENQDLMSGLRHYVESSAWSDSRIDQIIHIFTEINNLNEERVNLLIQLDEKADLLMQLWIHLM